MSRIIIVDIIGQDRQGLLVCLRHHLGGSRPVFARVLFVHLKRCCLSCCPCPAHKSRV